MTTDPVAQIIAIGREPGAIYMSPTTAWLVLRDKHMIKIHTYAYDTSPQLGWITFKEYTEHMSMSEEDIVMFRLKYGV